MNNSQDDTALSLQNSQYLPAIRAVGKTVLWHSACCVSAFTVTLACCFLYKPNRFVEKTEVFIYLLFAVQVCWDVQTINGCFLSGCSWIPPSQQVSSWKFNTQQKVKWQNVSAALGSETLTFVSYRVSIGLIMGNRAKFSLKKTKIIDDILLSDALIIWDPGIKYWKRETCFSCAQSSSLSVKLRVLTQILDKLIIGLI